jgi:16S rRNA (cytidine1402-2'-O)-methyltransferase
MMRTPADPIESLYGVLKAAGPSTGDLLRSRREERALEARKLAGTLSIVSTPIGNLQDITARALDVLRTVDLVACEDTRQTAKLLRSHQIEAPMISLHDHNERSRAPGLITQLQAGKMVALVSDGGTPLINDPGWWLVRQAIDAQIPVSWIPGPTALIGALVLSGLPTERFVFEGFLPAKSTARRKRLHALQGEPRTIVCYESPHRVLATLRDVRELLGDVRMACARELTKAFEDVRRGTVSECVAWFEQHPPRGEFVIVLSTRHTAHSTQRG